MYPKVWEVYVHVYTQFFKWPDTRDEINMHISLNGTEQRKTV